MIAHPWQILTNLLLFKRERGEGKGSIAVTQLRGGASDKKQALLSAPITEALLIILFCKTALNQTAYIINQLAWSPIGGCTLVTIALNVFVKMLNLLVVAVSLTTGAELIEYPTL